MLLYACYIRSAEDECETRERCHQALNRKYRRKQCLSCRRRVIKFCFFLSFMCELCSAAGAGSDSRRTESSRRHTILGCHAKATESQQSTPVSRPSSRQAEFSTTVTMNPLNPMNASAYCTEIIDIDESEEPECATEVVDKQWQETVNVSDRLALTLEEIVHIRSVMTKAELEGLPVGVRIKEDVERRKVCFLCLRTRFSIFGQWGVQCKLCHRTVCTKCHSKVWVFLFRN